MDLCHSCTVCFVNLIMCINARFLLRIYLICVIVSLYVLSVLVLRCVCINMYVQQQTMFYVSKKVRESFVKSGKSSESNFDPTPNEAEVVIKGAREAHFCVIQSEITGEVCTNEPDWCSKSS